MNNTLTILIFLISIYSFGQKIPKYPNDSAFIFSVLKKSELRDVEIGDKKNGIFRHYRKIDGKWCLAIIELIKNGNVIWGQKPFDKENEEYFELNWLSYSSDSLDIVIPYDTGKKWQTLSIRNNKIVGEITTYYRNGKTKEIINTEKAYYKEYYPSGNLKMEMTAKKILDRHQMNNGICKFYNEKGNITEIIDAVTLMYSENSKNGTGNFNIYKGKLSVFDNIGNLKKEMIVDSVHTIIPRKYD